MSWIFSLLGLLFKAWLSFKESTSVRLGRAEATTEVLKATATTEAQMAQAAADAPQTKAEIEKLLEDHKF